MLARSKKYSTNTKKVKPLAENEGSLLRDKIEAGVFFSADKCFCKTSGHLPTGYGGGVQVIAVFKEALSIMMSLLVWFGLKIKSL